MAKAETIPFSVESASHWKALSHPLRLGILRLLSENALTNEELALALGVASGKLHFHTRTLLNTGLIETAGTRQKGPITEKLYRSAAQGFLAASSSDAPSDALLNAVVAGLALYQNSKRQMPDRTQLGYHLVLSLRPERVHEFLDRFRQIADDFAAADSSAPDAQAVALTMLIHTLPPIDQKGNAS